MPVVKKPAPLAIQKSEESNLASSASTVLDLAEQNRAAAVEFMSDRLSELADPELLIKDVLAATQRKIASQSETVTVDALVVALKDYNPLRQSSFQNRLVGISALPALGEGTLHTR